MRLVDRAVVAEHPAAFDPLAVEPGHRTAQEPNRGRPLLVREDLDVRQADGVIHGHVELFVASAGELPLRGSPVIRCPTRWNRAN